MSKRPVAVKESTTGTKRKAHVRMVEDKPKIQTKTTASVKKPRKKISDKQKKALADKREAKKKELIDIMASKTIEALDKAIAAGETGEGWKMPWRTNQMPINVVTGKNYSGTNWFYLSMLGGHNMATYKQFQSVGLQVRKMKPDDQRFSILVPKEYKKKVVDSQGNPVIDPKTNEQKIEKRIYFNLASVFSIYDTEEMEGEEGAKADLLKKHGQAHNAHTPIKSIEKVLDAFPVTFKEGSTAFYTPATDTVTMPPMSSFDSYEEFIAVKAHECAHATGHKSRLNRETLAGTRVSNDIQARAKEELVAEMASSMLANHWGIEHVTQKGHNKYLIGWKSLIKEDPEVLTWAANEAKKAVNLILQDS